jgi:hypothetical protein
VKVAVERTGGFAGIPMRWSCDVDQLDTDLRTEVHELLAQAPAWPGATGADRFQYRLTAEQPGGSPLDVRFGEPLPEPAQRLLAVVRDAERGS